MSFETNEGFTKIEDTSPPSVFLQSPPMPDASQHGPMIQENKNLNVRLVQHYNVTATSMPFAVRKTCWSLLVSGDWMYHRSTNLRHHRIYRRMFNSTSPKPRNIKFPYYWLLVGMGGPENEHVKRAFEALSARYGQKIPNDGTWPGDPDFELPGDEQEARRRVPSNEESDKAVVNQNSDTEAHPGPCEDKPVSKKRRTSPIESDEGPVKKRPETPIAMYTNAQKSDDEISVIDTRAASGDNHPVYDARNLHLERALASLKTENEMLKKELTSMKEQFHILREAKEKSDTQHKEYMQEITRKLVDKSSG